MRGHIKRHTNLFVKLNLEELVPPDRMVKALVLLTLHTIRSERAMGERITFDMLFRWFLDMKPDEDCFDHSDFTNFRTRIKGPDVASKFSNAIVQ